jgi:hypothetical protein
MDLKLRVMARHLGKDRREMYRTGRQWHSNPEPSTKVTFRQDLLARTVDLGTDLGRMIAKQDPGLRQTGSARRPCKKLGSERTFDPRESPANHRLGDPQLTRGQSDTSGICDLDKYPQILDVHLALLRCDTLDIRLIAQP